jgi:hypothetical protein
MLLVSSPLQALQFGDYVIKDGKMVQQQVHEVSKEEEQEFDKILKEIPFIEDEDDAWSDISEVAAPGSAKGCFSCLKFVKFWIMRLCCCKRK